MGNVAPLPIESDTLKGNLMFETIEFEKLWTEEDKYQLCKLVFKTSDDISTNFYYHDLLGIDDKAPLLRNRSIITSCDFTRKYGENHIFRGIWEGELKPSDTIKYTKSLTKEITVNVKNEADLGSYIRDETKCEQFMKIENSFMSGDKLRDNGDGILKLEVTMDKYRRRKGEKTQWAIYQLTIPQQAIVSALENAVIAEKPKIVEKFAKIHEKQETKPPKAILFTDNTNANRDDLIKQIDVLKEQLNDEQKERRMLEDGIMKLKKENNALQKENVEFKTKYYALLKNDIKDIKNYRNWTSDIITDWILSLEPKPGIFKPYENELRNKLREESVTGPHLSAVSTTDLDRFGIKSFGHKQIVLENIKILISQHDSHRNYSNEGKKNDTSLCG